MRLSIEVPAQVNISIIEAALAMHGARIVRRAAKATADDLPLPIIVNGPKGLREIDGLDVARGIAAYMRELKARQWHNGRTARDFSTYVEGRDTAAGYISAWCAGRYVNPGSVPTHQQERA